MTATELRLIIRQELERVLRSGSISRPGFGALVTGDNECRENEKSESMDPTLTETSGASSSPEQTASEMLRRLRAKPKPNVLPMRPARRAKAGQSATRSTRTR